MRVEDRILRDVVTDDAKHGIEHTSSNTVEVMIARLPNHFPATPLVPAFNESHGLSALLVGIVVAMACET